MRLRRRTTVVIAAVSAIVLLVALVVLIIVLTDDSEPRAQGTPVYEHLHEFQALADEHGDRAAGNSGYEAAAQYVEEELASAGYESTRQYFTFEWRGEQVESFSVLAETEEGSDENVIMLGAHLDGVPDSPAINDNASGVSALLETAKELSQQEEINNKVRFAWWGAEEFRGTPGSRHYVEDLAENDPGALEDIAAYINIDMVASPNYVIGVYDAREQRSRLDVPEGSVEVMEVFTDYFDSREQPWLPTAWNFSSDQVSFVREDVPVGGLFTGSSARNSPREAAIFDGTAGQQRDPNYHTSDDDIDNVSQEGLNIMTGAIKHAASSLADDTSALE